MRKGCLTKTAFAALVFIFAGGVAYAQSSVTLYGVVDAGLLYLSKTPGATSNQSGGSQFALTNSGYSPSLIGVKGTENLGSGYKVNFTLESGISVANGGFDNPGGGPLFGRQANVGLSGGFGTVTAGVQYSPFFISVYESDPRSTAVFGSAVVPYLDNALVVGIFNPNAIVYTTPNISGFQSSLMMALGGVSGNFQVGRQYAISAKYTNSTFLFTTAYYDGNANVSLPNVLTTPALRGIMVGASYRFGTLIAKTQFVNYKASIAPYVSEALGGSPTPSTDSNVSVYSVGFDYLILPDFDVNLGVYYSNDEKNHGNRSIMGAVGSQYFLSKRTSLYAEVGIVNNRCSSDGACLGTGLTGEGTGYGGLGPLGVAGLPSSSTVGATVGMRHMF